jgi:hypothetical protein
VAGFGAWIVEDLGEPNQFVLKVTEAGGKVSASDPLESGNGTALAVEGFLGAVSNTGIIRAVIEQQTLAGVASDASFFYLDHVQIGPAPPCLDPFADLDGDGDVDQDDFGFFQACLTDSPGGAELRCGCADRDHDGSVDRADLMAFLACKDGAGLPATVECDD